MPAVDEPAEAHRAVVVVEIQAAVAVEVLYEMLVRLEAEIIEMIALQRMVGLFVLAEVVERPHVPPLIVLDVACDEAFAHDRKMRLRQDQLLLQADAREETHRGQDIQHAGAGHGEPVDPFMREGERLHHEYGREAGREQQLYPVEYPDAHVRAVAQLDPQVILRPVICDLDTHEGL